MPGTGQNVIEPERCAKGCYKHYCAQPCPLCSSTVRAADRTQARKSNKYKQKVLLGLLLPLTKTL